VATVDSGPEEDLEVLLQTEYGSNNNEYQVRDDRK
jgi:hypothetical protein